jgi:hypothetical protein
VCARELCHLLCVVSSSDWDSLQLYQPWVPTYLWINPRPTHITKNGSATTPTLRYCLFSIVFPKMRKVGNWDCTKRTLGVQIKRRVSKSNDLSNLGTSTWHPLKKSLQWWNAKSNSLRWCVVWTVLCNMIWISKSSRLNFSGGPKYGFSTPSNLKSIQKLWSPPRNLAVYWKGSYDHTQECMCSLGSSTLYRGHFYIMGSSTPMANITWAHLNRL